MKNNIRALVTHDGRFHTDDVLSYHILHSLFPDATLVRTREENYFNNSELNKIIFDVGLEYDENRNMFDHHQIDGPVRDNGVPYSSVGLIWKKFGKEYLFKKNIVEQKLIDFVHKFIDENFIEIIDAGDNGYQYKKNVGISGNLNLHSFISSFNKNVNNKASQYMNFLSTDLFLEKIMSGQINNALAYSKSYSVVQNAKMNQEDERYLILEKDVDYLRPLLEMGDTETLYVIVPKGDKWYISCVNKGLETFELRSPLPKEWAGLNGKELEAKSGIQGAFFCHKGRFIGANKTYEGALEMLHHALENNPAFQV